MNTTATQRSKWISGRVPDPDKGEAGDMLVFTRMHFIRIGYWDGFYWHYDGQYHLKTEVLAFRALPEPPYEVIENV